MIIRRRGKCDKCQAPVTVTKEFAINTDMFNPDVAIDGPAAAKIKKWRDKPIYCELHQP